MRESYIFLCGLFFIMWLVFRGKDNYGLLPYFTTYIGYYLSNKFKQTFITFFNCLHYGPSACLPSLQALQEQRQNIYLQNHAAIIKFLVAWVFTISVQTLS
jgi:hypothetical protein